jgi:hypothetical integral membrane protein (TIGR02206 family)
MGLLQYFAKDYHGPPFILFGPVHLVTLLVVVLFILWLTRFKGASQQTLRNVRWTLAIVLWLNEIAWHVWNIAVGTWNIQTMLPLHLCSVLVWLTGFMLIFRNYTLYEFAYFLGIGAAIQSLITPDAGMYGFPHFRYIQPIISHGLLVSIGVYMTVVEDFRPTWKSMVRVFVITNLYMFVIYFVNLALGSNYMMVNAKPDVTSLFDVLPAWPWYIPCAEALAVAIFLLLYVPFVIKDQKRLQVEG